MHKYIHAYTHTYAYTHIHAKIHACIHTCILTSYTYLTCKRGSVGQSEGLSIPRSSVRFRLNPDNSNSHEFELHRPSNKCTKLLLKVIIAIIIISTYEGPHHPLRFSGRGCCSITVRVPNLTDTATITHMGWLRINLHIVQIGRYLTVHTLFLFSVTIAYSSRMVPSRTPTLRTYN